MFYLPKTPSWIKKLYNKWDWEMPAGEQTIYLSFDDGPDPDITPFVLSELDKYGAKATFFCVGRNVAAHPGLYRRLIDEGHATGNHTHDHLNGWNTPAGDYLANIDLASTYINSNLFRPPYGRITGRQSRILRKRPNPLQVIMWTVLSGDFDTSSTQEKCLKNVLDNAKDGSIIVFHDSRKAEPRLRFVLPKVLEHFSSRGFRFRALPVKELPKDFMG